SAAECSELLNAEREKYLRLYAEYENFRRRSQKERETLCSQTRAEVIAKLLPVYDNLARALETPCSDEAFLRGVELTAAQLDDILSSLGVEAITAVGEKFDPERHNAVSSVATEDAPPGTVTAEFQKGFALNGIVIRHAVVQVNP
ncbi:MAG: nucleotide exchange factor GrpE, partial [Oscillospiraceae bacterium]|nr:nucleotide exchange factor GrpE [Oscillospiraceae bacterium]